MADQVHPRIASRSAIRFSNNIPFLYAVRCLLCHFPARFSSGSVVHVEGAFCIVVYCVIQFCFCSSHVYIFSL